MSKAFVKEGNDEEEDLPEAEGPLLPAGSKNYMTPKGAQRLKDELHHLVAVERPKIVDVVSWAASLGIAPKMPTIFTASAGYVRSTDASAF